MEGENILSAYNEELTEKDFNRVAQFIEKNVGIKMPPTKRIMMQSRLATRMRKLNLSSYKAYIDYVFNDESQEELILMIDSLTTNKTDFFREPDHFTYLTKNSLPYFVSNGIKNIKIWSAGCSSGQEPYTLSIVMKEYMNLHKGEISNFSITASDISTKVLGKAIDAVYDLTEIENLPYEIKHKYFLKSSNPEKKVARLKPEIRSCVTFKRLNFMDNDFLMEDIYQVIFCRNVLIYFDKETQENVIRKLIKYLQPGGYLFLGHSETILTMDLPLDSVAPTVYKKRQ